MFAIALYDIKSKKLILARDHFGIKPLYYSILPDQKIIFSSEIKPLFNSGLIKKKPNDKIIYRYLKYRIHDDNEQTFFEGIKKLLPGQILVIKNSKIEIKKYSNLERELLKIKKNKVSDEKAFLSFRRELIKSIAYRLIADVPVGTCLSGGLDSSIIVTAVNKLKKGSKQKTFSAVFPGSVNDEEKYIDVLLTKLKNVQIHKTHPKPEKFFEEIEDFVKTQEEPTISTGPYAQYQVMRLAKGKVKVLLDGQGADEEMAGYLPYYFVYLRQLLKEKNYLVFFKESLSSFDILIRQLIKKGKSVSVEKILSSDFAMKHKREEFQIVNDDLKKRLIDDIFRDSLQSLLRYEDRNSMRFSIEGRVPFLDFNLLRFIFSLDESYIIRGGWNKFILRQSVPDLLPDVILKRRNKIGFTTPEDEWFKRMKNRIYTVFTSESFGKRRYFNQASVLNAFQQYLDGKNSDTMVFWRLLNVELWLRIFFDSNSRKQETRKQIKPEIKVTGKTYSRHLIKTDLFKKGDNYVKKIADYVNREIKKNKFKGKILVVVSEKIIAISQGRSYFIWDIKPGFFANLLSKYVTKTPYGIGLGSPWTMQLAISEVGLPRILTATILSALTRPFGVKGVFYHVAGREAASIDGPTEYSLYPSNVSAKLGPKNPQKVAEKIHQQIPGVAGVVIIDANDLGRDVLGNSTNLSNKLVEEIFRDNPMGQGREQTPITLVSYR
jgi:asparagine synthase (glutamine-hydrolysing)